MAELMVKEEELVQKEELVKCLQEELVQVRPMVVVVVVVFCSSKGYKSYHRGDVIKN